MAETGASQIRVYRDISADGKPGSEGVFATDLGPVFGMAFYPPGNDPKWLHVSNTITTVSRFAYNRNDLTATASPRKQSSQAFQTEDTSLATSPSRPMARVSS